MPDKLDEIFSEKKKELDKLKEKVSLEELIKKVKTSKRNDIRSFSKTLESPTHVTLIAEIKKASPSAGDINASVDILEQARLYESAGASAISVLTDFKHFKGEIGFLKQVREVTTIPILRKDFIFDPWQIYESYLAGADALLLIATKLDQQTLRDLVALTNSLGMEALVEVHTEEDIKKALETDALNIGINARDLTTFVVDLENIFKVIGKIPKSRRIVAESGIENGEQVKRLAKAGAGSILVGTTLMTAGDVGAKVRELCIPK